MTLGYDIDKPWRELPKKDRDWILHTDEQPVVPVYAGFTPAETRAALRRYQQSQGLVADGYPTLEVLQGLVNSTPAK